MSGEKWTPGPWIVDFDLYDEEGPLDVPEVNGRILDQDNCIVCQASTEANAFLIAAAPTLFEYVNKCAMNGCKEAEHIIKGVTSGS